MYARDAPKLSPQILPFVVFGALWFLLIKHLALYWSALPQYSFGWLGPVICAYLFFIRWLSRPAPSPAPSARAQWIYWTAGLAFLPTWLIEQPNPDWRLLSWLLTLEIVTLSLCAIYFAGGRSWLRHFAFSVCLILSTVPWPGVVEIFITQGLMQVVAWVTVGLLNLSGIGALQHGNLIAVKSGLLDINEACSGVRSLQAVLMVSLFLGELYRARWPRRVLFVAGGALIAFFCNIGRTYFLSWVGARNGIAAVPQWHDPAGFIILAICFLALWGLVHLVSGAIPVLPPESRVSSKASSAKAGDRSCPLALGQHFKCRSLVPGARNRRKAPLVLAMARLKRKVPQCGLAGSARRSEKRRRLDRKRWEPLDGTILQVGRRPAPLADFSPSSPAGELFAGHRVQTPGRPGNYYRQD